MGSIVIQTIVVFLIGLFAISFALFIRRLLVNSSFKNYQLKEIEKKLDKIIEKIDESNK